MAVFVANNNARCRAWQQGSVAEAREVDVAMAIANGIRISAPTSPAGGRS